MANESENSNPQKTEVIKNAFSATTDAFVLYVEDEASLRSIFIDDLSNLGVLARAAKDADEALQIIAEHGHNIVMIFSDLKMPGMDGIEFRKRLLAQKSTLPFAVISAHIDRELALSGIELKVSALINKPFQTHQIIDVLYSEALPRLNSMNEDREIKAAFISDSESLVEECEKILLRLEKDANDVEALNHYYAIMHTLKGTSAFFEPKDMHRYVHSYEEILKKLQRNELKFSRNVIATLFKGFDLIRELFEEFKTGNHKQRDIGLLIQGLQIDDGIENEELTRGSEDAQSLLADSELTTQTAGVIKQKPQEDIKVSIKLLDEFMQMSGEVTVVRNMLNKCVSSIERRFAGDRDVGMLTELLAELHKINSGVQNKMTEIRKVPLKTIMRPIPRAVREISKSLGKDVELEITGEETRVDTSIAEVLNNSLLHVIKNSVDHGLEMPEERIAKGKPESGKIQVAAFTRDEKVILRISDDGKGLDIEAIKNKLVRNKSHTREEVDAMATPDLWAMIFSSGFSTANQVTEISGRGVGMSMVKDSVDSIGGRIVIDSQTGKGASFQFELPVPKSVLIANCLSFRIGASRLSVVQDDILRVLQISRTEVLQSIQTIDRSEYLIYEEELVPLVEINSLLKLNQNINRVSLHSDDFRRIIVLKSGTHHRPIAIEVSEVLEVEDMVIKNLHPLLNQKSLFKGVTFLDDGGVGLILSTNGLMDAVQLKQNRTGKNAMVERSRGDSTRGQYSSSINEMHQALTVRCGDEAVLAISQYNVFRIEEIAPHLIKRSGPALVFPYRDSVIRLVSLESLIKKTEERLPEKMVQAVIAKFDDKLLAVVVDQILDMISFGEVRTELAQPIRGIAGHVLVGDQTITLLDLKGLINQTTADLEESAIHSESPQNRKSEFNEAA